MHMRSILVLGSVSLVCGVSLTTTPFGVRPVECILEVPSGALVEPHPDPLSSELIITHPLLGTWRHTADPLCSMPEYAPTLRNRGALPSSEPAHRLRESNQDCQDMPCTCDSLPCNNWIDNAGWQMDPRSNDTTPYIGGFSTIMNVPGTPVLSDSQELYYFPGAENTDGTPRHGDGKPGFDRTILQPVLTYGPNGWCTNSTTGWCISSWNCCPKGVTVHSPYIYEIKPGDAWLGLFNLTDADNFEVVSRDTLTGQETKLAAPKQGRNFNWADVTLEVYGAHSCPMFPVGPMSFTEMSMWDEEGQALDPQWLTTHDKPCGGTVTVNSKTSITIEHNAFP